MTPKVIHAVGQLRDHVGAARRAGKSVGLVPTMGALHEGHASLLRLARSDGGLIVATIFVNPTQFGPAEDFTRYPRTLDADLEICRACGTDVVFVPEVAVIYPGSFRTFVEVTELQDVLCGAARPGHFRGVCTIVLKLFNLVQPDRAYFGQKDAQQVRIIQQMVRDLDVPVRIVVGPTAREPDGLALSSRNRYLDPDQRRQAVVLHRALLQARGKLEAGERDSAVLEQSLAAKIATAPAAVLDYAAVVDADSLMRRDRIEGPTLLALAVKFGGTRLIDNLLWPG